MNNNNANNDIKNTDNMPKPISSPKAEQEIDYTGKKLVALTFDDGPNLDTTPKVLDILEKHGVVASFYLIGNLINEDTKAVMERQLELGCEIGNHSWNHNFMNEYSAEEIQDEIKKTSDKIKEMVGVTPEFFRPPYIALSDTMYESIDLPFICGVNCLDWDNSVSAKRRVELIFENVKDGDIVLLHDLSGNINTVDALDEIIQGLLDDGYALVTVSQLFKLKGVDPNVKKKLWSGTYN